MTTSHHVAVKVGPSSTRLQFGDVTLVPDERLVMRNGQSVPLTPKAFDLLQLLAENPGRLLTKEQMLQAVWADTAVEESNLSYHVFAIRKALGDTAENGQLIETVKKTGYRFTAAVTRVNGNVDSLAVSESASHEQAGTSAAPAAGEESAEGSGSEDRRTKRVVWRSAVWFVAGVLCAGGGAVLFNRGRTEPRPPLVVTKIPLPPGVRPSQASPFAVSPDATLLVFAGKGPDGVSRLWLRPLGGEPRPLPGTETALGALTPPMFWSPDSLTVVFDAAGQLKRFDLRDNATRTVCALPGVAVGGSENKDGVVIVGQPAGGLFRCSEGQATQLTRLDPANGETAHAFPWFLPDGRHYLYVRVARKAPEGSGVYIGSLEDGPDAPRPKRLLASGFGAAYVPTKGMSTGHVIFMRDTTLLAQIFGEQSLQVRGDAVPIASPVGSFLDGAFFSTSANDVIAFRPPDTDFQLTWFDRQGKVTRKLGDAGRYSSIAISPDDSSVAVSRETVGSNIDKDIWILDLSRPTSTRVTFGPLLEDMPVWAGTRRLIYNTTGDVSTLFEQVADGSSPSRPLLDKTQVHRIPTSVSRDGNFVLFTEVSRSRSDVWALPLRGGKAFPVVRRDLDQDQARISPDGQWVAYASNESGRYEVMVQRFIVPSDGASQDLQTTPVSNGGGSAPRWGRGGRELYFTTPDGRVMVADVHAGPELTVKGPRELFRLPSCYGDWDVLSDGSQFLIALPAGADGCAPFTVLQNRLAHFGNAPR